jgi:asparagine synthase (glutamine-hydrolysing)
MCGIAACVDLRREGRAVRWALPSLRHRGPDGEGVLETPHVVLEHARLAIIDPENREADQPFVDPSGRWAITYNGEIFNFRALRAELEARGVTFRTQSDTEVVLLGFIHHGVDLLPRLRGMFAFVIHDRETGEVFAARDQIGVKPLYYRVEDGFALFASEVRPLLRFPGLRAELDPAGVVEFLAFGGSPSARTIVQNVAALLPGHALRIAGGRVTVSEYWDLLEGDPLPATGDVVAELRERLDEAVAASMVADVPVGLMLSGGLDSSAVAALGVTHVPPESMTAYSVDFGRPDDESATAARLAGELGVRHRVIRITERESRDAFDGWLDDLDYPTGNSTWIATSFIAQAAREDGMKVLLSGDGGDEVFGGYTRWMKYLRMHDRLWARTPESMRRLGGRAAAPFTSGLNRDIARRAAEGGDLFVTSRLFHEDELERHLGALGAEAARVAPPETRVRELRREFDERRPGGDYLAWMSFVALKTKIVDDFLARLDKMGMRHAVEGRVPLLDPVMTPWVLRLPQAVKVPGGAQKKLFRDAVTPLLPQHVIERRKQGFSPPTDSWARELLAVEGGDAGSLLVGSGLIEAGTMAELRAHPQRTGFQEWTLGVLEQWCRRYVGDVAEVEAAAPSASR